MTRSFVLLWPYEETRLIVGKNPAEYLLSTPWLGKQIRTSDAGVVFAERILCATSERLSSELMESYSFLLQDFINEPFCYLMPRYDLASGLDVHEEALPLSPPIQATWDRQSMLELSKIHLTERYDPLTLFSACRRFFYLEAVEHEATQELFDYLSSVTAEKDLFAKGTAFLLAQTRYITEVAEAALSAALPRAQSAEGLLKHFIKSERGHDRLFARALKSMGTHVDTTPHSSTIVLMETLQTIAKTNFLAFAFALSLFERADFANVQKLSSVLSGGGLHAAASVVEIHDALNEQGNHDAIGLKLLNAMAPVSFSYAKSAILWAEYIAFLINTHSRSLLTAIRSVAAGAA